jgi:hypothetical protein
MLNSWLYLDKGHSHHGQIIALVEISTTAQVKPDRLCLLVPAVLPEKIQLRCNQRR